VASIGCWRLHEFADWRISEGENIVKHAFAASLAAVSLPLCAAAQTGTAPGQKIAVTIDAGKTSPPISPYIYGQFIEHIGDLINRSLWAEMLDDRKFYSAISSKPVLNAGRGGGRGRV